MPDDDPKTPAEPEISPNDIPIDLQALSPVILTPARTLEELKQAYSLVYQSYLDRKYIAPARVELRFGVHNLLPETATFVGVLRDTVIATVTLVVDSPLGLPMDEIYHDELEQLRRQGCRLAEVTMLADRRRQFARTLPMVLAMFRMLIDFALQVAKVDQLCITLNPRHASFYTRLLHFCPLGGQKPYPTVIDNPALAMRFPLDSLPRLLEEDPQYRSIYQRTEVVTHQPFEERYIFTPQAAREMARFLPNPEQLGLEQREHLRKLYGIDLFA